MTRRKLYDRIDILMLPDLPPRHHVAVDTETSGLHPDDQARVSCISIAWIDPQNPTHVNSRAYPYDQGVRDKLPHVQLEFGDDQDPNLDQHHWENTLTWLSDKNLVMQNALFDIQMLRAGTRHWDGIDLTSQVVWDTMVATSLLDPRQPTGLEATCLRHNIQGPYGGKTDGREAVQSWLKRNKHPKGRYDLVPWTVMQDYVTEDTVLTILLWRQQMERLDGQPDLQRACTHDMELIRTLAQMEKRGIGYNVHESIEISQQLEKEIAHLIKEAPFPTTPAGARKWFYHTQGRPVLHRTDSGVPSVSAHAIAPMVRNEVPWAAEWLLLTKMQDAVTRWYRGYPEAAGSDGRLRPSFQPTRVKSGRMSVHRVQLQAIPKDDKTVKGVKGVKKLFIPAEGKQLWNLDLSQAELRVATAYSRCKRMRSLLDNGADIHGETCKHVLGGHETDPDWKYRRDIAKRLTFGSIFQIGPSSFQRQLEYQAGIHLPLTECQKIVWGWRDTYPEFGTAYRMAERLAKKRGWVKVLHDTDLERKSWFGNNDYEHTAWSRVVQGSLAEFVKRWIVETEWRWPGVLVLTVHDSLVLELDIEDGDQIAHHVAQHGAQRATDLFGIEMKVDVEPWRY